MTFQQLQSIAACLKIERGNIGDRVDDILDRARINADDTVYREKARSVDDYDRIALDTVREILAYSDDKEVQNWFSKVGISY